MFISYSQQQQQQQQFIALYTNPAHYAMLTHAR